MSFVLEDGSGVIDSNSYADVAFADAYFSDRKVVAWTGITSSKQAALISATDYIETYYKTRFKGAIEFPETPQALSFPRINVTDANGLEVSGIPTDLKKAAVEYALRAMNGTLVVDAEIDPTGRVVIQKREKTGPIDESTTYSASKNFASYPIADGLIRQYLLAGGSNRVIR